MSTLTATLYGSIPYIIAFFVILFVTRMLPEKYRFVGKIARYSVLVYMFYGMMVAPADSPSWAKSMGVLLPVLVVGFLLLIPSKFGSLPAEEWERRRKESLDMDIAVDRLYKRNRTLSAGGQVYTSHDGFGEVDVHVEKHSDGSTYTETVKGY